MTPNQEFRNFVVLHKLWHYAQIVAWNFGKSPQPVKRAYDKSRPHG